MCPAFRNEYAQSYEYSTVWDADKIKGCKCDDGLSGYDCSISDCPYGDDPLTTGQVGRLEFVCFFLLILCLV